MILPELEKLFILTYNYYYHAVNTYLGLGVKSIFVGDLLEYYSIHCVYRSPSIYGKYGHSALCGNIYYLKWLWLIF